jgi:hypothetical protein
MCDRGIKYKITNGSKYRSAWLLCNREVFFPSTYHPHLVSSASQMTCFPFSNSVLTKISEVLSMHDSTQVDWRNLNRLPSMNRTIVGVASKESHRMRHVPIHTHTLWIQTRYYFHSYGPEYDRRFRSIDSNLNTLKKGISCFLFCINLQPWFVFAGF